MNTLRANIFCALLKCPRRKISAKPDAWEVLCDNCNKLRELNMRRNCNTGNAHDMRTGGISASSSDLRACVRVSTEKGKQIIQNVISTAEHTGNSDMNHHILSLLIVQSS